MLEIVMAVYEQMRRHGETAYPSECCGILIGLVAAESRSVTRAIAAENAATDSLQNRYAITPLQLVRAWREARADGLEVLGFYHSHPDCAAIWSRTDLAEAHWLGCSYVITAVLQGGAQETRSYRLAGASEEEKRFEEEELCISETP